MNKNIQGDFGICISVPLKKQFELLVSRIFIQVTFDKLVSVLCNLI